MSDKWKLTITLVFVRLLHCLSLLPARERALFYLGVTLHSAQETLSQLRRGAQVSLMAMEELRQFKEAQTLLGFDLLSEPTENELKDLENNPNAEALWKSSFYPKPSGRTE